MANVIPIHKRDDKQNVEGYEPVLLLSASGKSLNVLHRMKCTHFFIESDLISPNQSGFKQGDSPSNQLLSIIHDIYESLDQGYEVRGAFLDISKTIGKVWHRNFTHKLGKIRSVDLF